MSKVLKLVATAACGVHLGLKVREMEDEDIVPELVFSLRLVPIEVYHPAIHLSLFHRHILTI
jgi:hypothetical protein